MPFAGPSPPLREAMEQFERQYILRVLERVGGT